MPQNIPPFQNYYRIWRNCVDPLTYQQIIYAARARFWLEVLDSSSVIILHGQRIVAKCSLIPDAALIAALLAAHDGVGAIGATSSLSQAGESLAPSLATPLGERR